MIPRGKRLVRRKLGRPPTYTEMINVLRDASLSLHDISRRHRLDPEVRQQMLLLIDQITRVLDRDDGQR